MIARLMKYLLSDPLYLDREGMLRAYRGRPIKLNGVMPLGRREKWRARMKATRAGLK